VLNLEGEVPGCLWELESLDYDFPPVFRSITPSLSRFLMKLSSYPSPCFLACALPMCSNSDG
jgi:hypothetical protein